MKAKIPYKIDWELCFKRLLALSEMGVYITRADGHFWIYYGDTEFHNAKKILTDEGISVNNKIYGGFIEAIETMRQALYMAGVDIDEVEFDEWDLAPNGVDTSRITKRAKGKGGLF